MSRLPRVTEQQVINALKKSGFTEIRTRGSHHYLYHQGRDKIVTVPAHTGKILAPKTLKSILTQAGISTDEFRKLL